MRLEHPPPDSPAPAAAYRRLLPLAAGGMGAVELVARWESDAFRLYARKRMLADSLADPSARTMFMDEARLAGLVRDEHVVSVLDVGSDAEGPYLVMDYVEGVSAAELLTRSAMRDEPIPLGIAVSTIAQAARGLHAAHEATDPSGRHLRLIHRDVSPQNILLGTDGVVKVTDFGIAKAVGRSTRTVTGVIKGKLGYLSPEQLRFEEPDRRSDLFALGVVLFELLTARRLYKSGDDMDGPRRILAEPPPELTHHRTDVPAELAALQRSLLAKLPAERPPTALAVAEALERALIAIERDVGPTDIGAYVRGVFAADIDTRRSRIHDALTGERPPPMPRELVATRAGPPAPSAALGSTASPLRAAWIAALGAVAAVVAIGLGVGGVALVRALQREAVGSGHAPSPTSDAGSRDVAPTPPPVGPDASAPLEPEPLSPEPVTVEPAPLVPRPAPSPPRPPHSPATTSTPAPATPGPATGTSSTPNRRPYVLFLTPESRTYHGAQMHSFLQSRQSGFERCLTEAGTGTRMFQLFLRFDNTGRCIDAWVTGNDPPAFGACGRRAYLSEWMPGGGGGEMAVRANWIVPAD
ncbi:MAG: serine/threonine protein kinase [Sandaracinaceae bacterium]